MAPDVEFKIGDLVMVKGGGHEWIDNYNVYIGKVYNIFQIEDTSDGYKILTLGDESGVSYVPNFYSDEVELIEANELDDLAFDTDLLGLGGLL